MRDEDVPSLRLGRSNAEKLLESSGLDPTHPNYRFFLALLTKHLERTARYTRDFRSIGRALLELTDNDVSAQKIERIRALGEDLCEVELGADLDAIRLIAAGARGQAKQKSGQKTGGNASGASRRRLRDEKLVKAADALARLRARNSVKHYTKVDIATEAGLPQNKLRHISLDRIESTLRKRAKRSRSKRSTK